MKPADVTEDGGRSKQSQQLPGAAAELLKHGGGAAGQPGGLGGRQKRHLRGRREVQVGLHRPVERHRVQVRGHLPQPDAPAAEPESRGDGRGPPGELGRTVLRQRPEERPPTVRLRGGRVGGLLPGPDPVRGEQHLGPVVSEPEVGPRGAGRSGGGCGAGFGLSVSETGEILQLGHRPVREEDCSGNSVRPGRAGRGGVLRKPPGVQEEEPAGGGVQGQRSPETGEALSAASGFYSPNVP